MLQMADLTQVSLPHLQRHHFNISIITSFSQADSESLHSHFLFFLTDISRAPPRLFRYAMFVC